jgi:hypothetical protein
MTSSPASASGSVSSWIAKVRSMPASVRAWTISALTPNSANVGESSRTGASAFSGCDVSVSGTPASLCSSSTASMVWMLSSVM